MVLQLKYECKDKDSVAIPGPPLVITLGRSIILNASIKRIKIIVTLTGKSVGQVMSLNICQPPAPSMRAASFCSVERLSNPAINTMNMNGIHCQASPIITAVLAPQGITSHEDSSKPNHVTIGANGPLLISVNILNRYAIPTGVIIIGIKNTVLKKLLPLIFLTHSNAKPSPTKNWTSTPIKT